MYFYSVHMLCTTMLNSTFFFILFLSSCALESISFSPRGSISFYLLHFLKVSPRGLYK